MVKQWRIHQCLSLESSNTFRSGPARPIQLFRTVPLVCKNPKSWQAVPSDDNSKPGLQKQENDSWFWWVLIPSMQYPFSHFDWSQSSNLLPHAAPKYSAVQAQLNLLGGDSFTQVPPFWQSFNRFHKNKPDTRLKPNPNQKNVKPFRWAKMNTFVEIIAASSSFPTRVTITKVTPIYIFASSMLTRRTSAMISSHMMQFFFMLFTVHSKFKFVRTRRCPWTTRKNKNASLEPILIKSGF